MRKHIITIAGYPGSGKSSTAKAVAGELGYEHFSSGDLFRKMAAERGLSVEGINFAAEQQKDIDYAVDRLLEKMGKEKDSFVIDSRMAFHWIPSSFKVFLDLDPQTAAERTFAHIQNEGRTSQNASSAAEVRANTEKRVASEQKRYWDLYQVNPLDRSNYDLVVDTKVNDLQEVARMVLAAYKEWLNAP